MPSPPSFLPRRAADLPYRFGLLRNGRRHNSVRKPPVLCRHFPYSSMLPTLFPEPVSPAPPVYFHSVSTTRPDRHCNGSSNALRQPISPFLPEKGRSAPLYFSGLQLPGLSPLH